MRLQIRLHLKFLELNLLIREVAEWFKAHAWKACILEMESRVRRLSNVQQLNLIKPFIKNLNFLMS